MPGIDLRPLVLVAGLLASSAGAQQASAPEAVASAAMVRKWSTVLNGAMYDFDAYRKEVDQIFAASQ